MLTPRSAEYRPPLFTIPSAAMMAFAVESPSSSMRSCCEGENKQALNAEAPCDALSILADSKQLVMGKDIVHPFNGHANGKCSCGNGIGAWH